MAGKSKGGNTVAKVTAIAEPIARKLGLTLWDVRFEKEGSERYLRIFIDKEGGVGIDDCTAMSQALDAPLDEADPIEESYCLEVSSPGMNRKLTRPEHFQQMEGRNICTRLHRPLETGERELKGVLVGHDATSFAIGVGERTLVISRRDVSWVKLNDEDNFQIKD